MIEIRDRAGDQSGFDKALSGLLDAHATERGRPFDMRPVMIELRDGDRLIGGLSGYAEYGWRHIRYLALDPAYRGRGLGRRLLEALEARLRDEGARGIVLDTYGFQAEAFYRKLGFVEMGRVPGASPELDRIYLLKPLGPARIARVAPGEFGDWPGLLALLRAAFAPMAGVIDPPSSLTRMDAAALAAKAEDETLFLAREGAALVGCLFCAEADGALYLSKLATRPDRQGRGIGRALVAAAEAEARARGLAALTLQTRVELTGNHAAFAAMGFRETGRTAHPGYDRPTSVAMRKPLTQGKTGRCLCGAVSFAYDGPENWRGHCHCESCRRQTASPFTTFMGVPDGAWRWTGAAPAVYESSPGVRRMFCARCGAPVAYAADHYPGEIHFYASLLDDHAGFAPVEHLNWTERVAWVTLGDDLPRRSTSKKDLS